MNQNEQNEHVPDDSRAIVMSSGIPVETSSCGGVVRVHESVLASIVRKAACSVQGIVRLSGSSFVDNIAEIVGSKKMFDRSISIVMGETSVQIEVRVVAAYGSFLPEIAKNVQSAVIDEVDRITGMTVGKINVLIMDLDDVSGECE